MYKSIKLICQKFLDVNADLIRKIPVAQTQNVSIGC